MEQNYAKNQPEKKFSTGAISATIWKNEGVTKAGSQVEFNSVSLQRRYQDKNGQWQSSGNLRVADLPKAALVLNKAYEYLVLKEKESIDAGMTSIPEQNFNLAETV